MRSLISIAAVVTVALSGCASILNEENQMVNVSSSTGSEIKGTIDGKPFKGPGPVSIKRENKSKLLVTETEGCTKETALEKNVDPKFFVNILTGGVFGSSTDYGTEKMWKYSDNVVVTCKK